MSCTVVLLCGEFYRIHDKPGWTVFKLSRSGDDFSAPLEVGLDVRGTADWDARSVDSESDFSLSGVHDAWEPWYEYVTIPERQPHILIVLTPRIDGNAEAVEQATISIEWYGLTSTPYSIAPDASEATVTIGSENPCADAVSNPSVGQSCLVVTDAVAQIAFTVAGANSTSKRTEFFVPRDEFEFIEALSPNDSEGESLWDKVKDWGSEAWDDVVDVPPSLDRFAQIVMPGAIAGGAEIDSVKIEFNAQARGMRFIWSGQEWEREIDSEGSVLSYKSPLKPIAAETHDFPFNLNITDLKKNHHGGMWEFITEIRGLFLDLKNDLEASPPDLKQEMAPVLIAAANDYIWAGEGQ